MFEEKFDRNTAEHEIAMYAVMLHRESCLGSQKFPENIGEAVSKVYKDAIAELKKPEEPAV